MGAISSLETNPALLQRLLVVTMVASSLGLAQALLQRLPATMAATNSPETNQTQLPRRQLLATMRAINNPEPGPALLYQTPVEMETIRTRAMGQIPPLPLLLPLEHHLQTAAASYPATSSPPLLCQTPVEMEATRNQVLDRQLPSLLPLEYRPPMAVISNLETPRPPLLYRPQVMTEALRNRAANQTLPSPLPLQYHLRTAATSSLKAPCLPLPYQAPVMEADRNQTTDQTTPFLLLLLPLEHRLPTVATSSLETPFPPHSQHSSADNNHQGLGLTSQHYLWLLLLQEAAHLLMADKPTPRLIPLQAALHPRRLFPVELPQTGRHLGLKKVLTSLSLLTLTTRCRLQQ